MSSSTAKKNTELPVGENWESVCSVDDLVPGSGVCVKFGNKQVALFLAGEPAAIHAIGNFDPFSRANVLSRGIVGTLGEKLVVASPVYKQHFCLETGECLEDPAVNVEVFHARIHDRHVQLERSP